MIDLETSEVVEKSVVNKRRSSIFQRRSISHRQQDYDETINEDQKTSEKPKNNEEPQTFDLGKYISSLEQEQRSWKKTLNDRKSRRRILVKEESRVRDGIDLDISSLTDSEKSFLSDRPNYEGISDNIEHLSIVAVKAEVLNNQVNGLYRTLIERLNEEISRSKKQVIALSDDTPFVFK